MFRRYNRPWSSWLLLLLLITSATTLRPAAAAPKVEGRFQEYWEQQGGLPIFGLPITSAASETNADTQRNHLTQWFERNRFELHAQNARPYDVLLGRLGADRLQQQGRTWQQFPKAAPTAPHYFAQTGHAIAHDPFWRYWSSHGLEFDGRRGASFEESSALFGLPLSEPMMETNTSGDRVLTQWFERARFEDHGQKGVLLGLLGNEARQRAPGAPASQLKYLWPGYVPGDLSVMPQGSFANETMWLLHLAQPHAEKPDVTIGGGVEGGAPGRKLQDVTVRGQRGTTFATDAGHAVIWSEAGRVYGVSGNRGLNELLRIAERLEIVDRGTWEQRVGNNVPPAQDLKYLWPQRSPLTVWHKGGSHADEHGFVLHLAWPHATEPDATISGGAASAPPEGQGTKVTVRGRQGTLYTLGSRRALAWTEDGQFYLIVSTLSQSELLALANDLEELDLKTWRDRLGTN